MVYVDIINRIIDAEKNARKIAEDAKEALARLDVDLTDECARMRASYRERADKRIQAVTDSENKYADEAIAKLDRELADAIHASEENAARNSGAWVEKLFQKVIEIPELPAR